MTQRTSMTPDEAREIIKSEIMSRYAQWMQDRTELDDLEYGKKYGWQKSDRLMSLKDNLTAITFFQKYIFSGATQKGWERMGVENKALWGLSMAGWLSVTSSGYRTPAFYYVTQQRIKEIYKEARS